MKENEDSLIGEPMEDVPKIEPGEDCNARKSSDGIFKGYCRNRSGYKTDHVGDGRCFLHGGNSPRGSKSPNFKHGLFSDYLSEDDREDMEVIEARGNLANLQSMIDYEFLRLRRAIRNIEGEEENDGFWDAYNRIVSEAADTGLDSDKISSLAELFDSSHRALNERIEEIRRLVKTYEELTEGKSINIDADVRSEVSGPGGGAISIEWMESRAEQENEEESNDGE